MATSAQSGPDATSEAPPATGRAAALARDLKLDPQSYTGQEDKALAVMQRLQQYASLPERDRNAFPQFVAGQGFGPETPFHRAVVGRMLDFRTNPAWAPGILPAPSQAAADDNSTKARVVRAIHLAAAGYGAALREKVLSLATEENVGILMGFVALYVAAQWTPAG